MRWFGAAQVAVVAIAVGGLLLAPPANGPMAFYALSDQARIELPKVMFDDDRRLVARTTVAGGYVLQGARPSFFSLLFGHGILVLAAPAEVCGGDSNASA